jgi:hypothetical protein
MSPNLFSYNALDDVIRGRRDRGRQGTPTGREDDAARSPSSSSGVAPSIDGHPDRLGDPTRARVAGLMAGVYHPAVPMMNRTTTDRRIPARGGFASRPRFTRIALSSVTLCAGLLLSLAACGRGGDETPRAPRILPGNESAFLDSLEERSFQYFWQLSDPRSGLTPDRSPTRSFTSVGRSDSR